MRDKKSGISERCLSVLCDSYSSIEKSIIFLLQWDHDVVFTFSHSNIFQKELYLYVSLNKFTVSETDVNWLHTTHPPWWPTSDDRPCSFLLPPEASQQTIQEVGVAPA